MTTALAIGVLVAALACPLHMLWSRRTGRAACCAPGSAADSLAVRQRRLAARVDELSRSGSGSA